MFAAGDQSNPSRRGQFRAPFSDDQRFAQTVEDVCKTGDLIPVKLLSIDDQGRFKLSRKAALVEMGVKPAPEPTGKPERDRHRDRNRDRDSSRSRDRHKENKRR